MLKNKIQSEILSYLNFEPTLGQMVAIDGLANFVVDTRPNTCILLRGFAGTGKTSIIAGYVKALEKFSVKFKLLAPTGRAAKVLSEYSGYKANTIHKCIYRQKSMKEGVGRFVLDLNKLVNAIFIVDEASMLSNTSFDDSIFGSGKLLSDLIEYVKQGNSCRLILVGDTAQLPPVGLDLSPALDFSLLTGLDLDVKEFYLNEVVRQQKESGILYNATKIREVIDSGIVVTPKLSTKGFDDVRRIGGGELLEHLSEEYRNNGREGNVVICYSNKRANRFNNGVRSRILFSDEELSVGDYLMVARNSYFWVDGYPDIGFIANGDIVEVTRIGKRYEMYGFRFADLTIRLLDDDKQLIDVRIILDSLMMDGPSLGADHMKNLYQQVAQDYMHIKTYKARLKKIKEDSFFNAMQVKFAYAVTCHKAQGGQWPNVFIDQGFFRKEMLTREYLRWLYTAITRATEKVYLVNFDEAFFC
ncbi:MAG: ATP-dependent RecD-like DNA helicase [Bacteroidales bacterium]